MEPNPYLDLVDDEPNPYLDLVETEPEDIDPVAVQQNEATWREEEETRRNAIVGDAFKQSFAIDDREQGITQLSRQLQMPSAVVRERYEELRTSWEASRKDPAKWRQERPELDEFIRKNEALAPNAVKEEGVLSRLLRGLSDFDRAWRENTDIQRAQLQVEVGDLNELDRETLRLATKQPRNPFTDVDFFPDARKTPARKGTATSTLGMMGESFSQSVSGQKTSLLNFRLMLDPENEELKQRIGDLELQQIPIEHGESWLQMPLVNAAEIAPSIGTSTAAWLTGMGIGWMAKNPKVGLGIGRVLSGVVSFPTETGSAYGEFRKTRTDGGELVDHGTAASAALLYGLLSSGTEAFVGADMGAFGPLQDFIAAGDKKAFMRAILRDKGTLKLATDLAKRFTKSAAFETLEENIQLGWQQLAQHGAKTAQAGEAQGFDVEAALAEHGETAFKTFTGSLVTGAAQGATSFSFQMSALALDRFSHNKGATRAEAILDAAKESGLAKTAPEALAQLIRDETAKTGDPTTHVYVDPAAVTRFLQENEAPANEVLTELLGEDGPRRFQEAVTTGQKVDVPVAEFLEKWAPHKIADAVKEDITVRPDGETRRQISLFDETTQKRADQLVQEHLATDEEPSELFEREFVDTLEAGLARNTKMSEKDARTSVAVWRGFIRAMAEATNTPAEDLFRDKLVEISRTGRTDTESSPTTTPNRPLGPGVQLVTGRDVDPTAPVDTSFDFGFNVEVPDAPLVDQAKSLISRMRPANRELATAWLEYTQGQRTERPAIHPDMERKLARYGIVDPAGTPDFALNSPTLQGLQQVMDKRRARKQATRGGQGFVSRKGKRFEQTSEALEAAAARAPAATRAAFEQFRSMTPEQKRDKFLIDGALGVLNGRAFDLYRPEGKPLVGHIAVEGVKYLNDTVGHEHADGLYRAVARALHAQDATVAKVGGDFLIRVANEGELKEVVRRANEAMEAKGFAITGVVGADRLDAAKKHVALKKDLEGRGERAKSRAEVAPGVVKPVKPFGLAALGIEPKDLAFPAAGIQTKIPAELERAIAGMADADLFNRIYTEPETGLLSAEGWEAIPRKKFQAIADVNGLGTYNPILGERNVDKMLEAFGDAIKRQGGSSLDAAHLHGDEYVLQSDNVEDLKAFLSGLEDVSKGITLVFSRPGGEAVELKGVGFGRGIGESLGAADEELNRDKERLTREGKRGQQADLERLSIRTRDDDAGRDGPRGDLGSRVGEGPRGGDAQGERSGADPRGAEGPIRGGPQGLFPEVDAERFEQDPLRRVRGRAESIDEIIAEQDRKQAHIDAIKAESPGPREFDQRYGGKVLVSPDPSKPGAWRVTRFDLENGELVPTGHADARDYAHAIQRAADYSDLGYERSPRLFEQEDDGGAARGFVDIRREGIRTIYSIALNPRADLSTFLHESAHVFLDMIEGFASAPGATERTKADLQTIKNFTGTAANGAFEREHHEKFARAFEAYLMEGKAPSRELEGAFQRFKLWLTKIYRAIKALNVELNDDIRGVFDRLLATEEEIARTREKAGLKPMFRTPEEAGMSATEWQAYLLEQERAASTASRQADLRVMKDRLRETERWWKEEKQGLFEEALAEFNRRPDVRADRYIRTGVLEWESEAGTTRSTKVEPQKLDRQAVVDLLGEERARDLGALSKGSKAAPKTRAITTPEIERAATKARLDALLGEDTGEQGVHPDEVAELFGFGTGKELLEALLSLPAGEQWAHERSDIQMWERHGDVIQDHDKLATLVGKGLHGDHTNKWLLAEWKALRTRAGQGPAPIEAIKKAAKQIIDRKTLRDVQPNRFLRAERSAADGAMNAVARGNFAQAHVLKQQQILNHHLYREAVLAREEREAFEELLAKSAQRSAREKLGQANKGLLDVVDQITESLGVKDLEEPGDRQTLDELVAMLDGQNIGAAFDVPELRSIIGNPKPYGMLTMGQMRTVRDALKQLRAVAKGISNVMLMAKEIRADDVATAIAAEAADLNSKKPSRPRDEALAPFGWHVRQRWEGLKAMQVDPEQMLIDLGPTAHNFFMRGYLEARNAENDLAEKVLKFFAQKWDSLPKEMQRRRYEKLDASALPFPADINREGDVTRQWAWMVALNMGNESNKDRLLGGYNWTEPQVLSFLNENLTKEEWDFIQGVWDLMDKELFPAVAETYRKVNGLAPPKIQPTPIVTPHGTYRGGYMAAKYDPVGSRLGLKQEEADLANLNSSRSTRASISKGFTKERAKKYTDVINLQWAGVPAHVTQVIHYVTHDRFVRDAARMMKRPDVARTIQQRLGLKYEVQIEAWLKAVANAQDDVVPPQVADGLAFLGGARSRFVASTLGYSLTVAMGDLANPLMAVASRKAKARYMVPTLAKMAVNPMSWRSEALSLSPELRMRDEAFVSKLRKDIGEIGAPGRRGRVASFLEPVQEGAFQLFRWTDALTSTLVWEGVFREGLANGQSQADAARTADDNIRSMFPAVSAAEQPALLRDKRSIGAILAFFSYFSKVGNLVAVDIPREAGRKFRKAETFGDYSKAGVEAAGVAGKIAAVMFVLGPVGALLSGQGPDDDEEWGEWVMRKSLAAPGALVPILGSTAGEIAATWATAKAFDKDFALKPFNQRAAPTVAVFEKIWTLGQKAVADEEGEKAFWAALEAVGVFLKMPVNQSRRTLGYLKDWFEGDLEPEGATDIASGLIYGERENQPTNVVRAVGGR